MDLRDAVSYHQLVIASEGRTETTQRQYLYFESVFLRWLAASEIQPTLDALTVQNVRQALRWYQAQDVRQRLRGGEVGSMTFIDIMHLLARFLEREGIIPNDPLRMLKRVKVSKRLRQPFTQTEIIAMWGACRQSSMPTRDEALFLLLLDTGMRIGEATMITLDHLKLDQRMIVVTHDAKGRRERLVPVGTADRRDGGRTMRALRRYIGERVQTKRSGDRLFVGRDGYPLEPQGGSEMVSRLGKWAAVVDAGPHRLRHTFCTWYLVQYPGDEIGLRRIVGHLSTDVLASYVHFSQSLLAERAGHASLAEQWITMDKPAEPKLLPFHTGQIARAR